MSYMLGILPEIATIGTSSIVPPVRPTVRTSNRDSASPQPLPARPVLMSRDRHIRHWRPVARLLHPLHHRVPANLGHPRGESQRKQKRLSREQALDHPGQAFSPSQFTITIPGPAHPPPSRHVTHPLFTGDSRTPHTKCFFRSRSDRLSQCMTTSSSKWHLYNA